MTEPVSSPAIDSADASAPSTDIVAAGREALARHAWQEAFDLFSEADRQSGLAGSDLEAFAEAAFFAGKADQRPRLLERAVKAYESAGDLVRAAFVALDVADNLVLHRKLSLASAWTRRAERMLEGQPETYAHAALLLIKAELAKYSGDVPTGMTLAAEATEVAKRTGNRDLHALALTMLATMKVATGATSEGFALLEEAAFAAVNGELSPMVAGIASCQMISACRDLTDYQRAIEWIDATDRWCEQQAVGGFPGICRIHRAEIVALLGAWDRAEEELSRATTELAAYDAIPPMADGFYAIGEVRRLKGDFEGAEQALRQAHALGRSPQPALALIRLGTGRVGTASAAIDAALAEPNWDQWARGRLLAAKVEISLAEGDTVRARAAAEELAGIVGSYSSPALHAGKHHAFGRVLLAEGDAAAAARELRESIRSWREVGAPYEVARVRAVLSRAVRALGDVEDADLELAAARDEFARLGAKPDLAAVEAEIRSLAERRAGGTPTRRTFMFTDIVGSTSLAEAMGDEAWERLLAWHDETIRQLVARHGGQVVNSTGDGFFVAFAATRQGIDCAIAIQQALARHRESSGFAPPVRIGVHAADATQRGDDYSGVGVNVAARIAALAGAGQVVVSEETLAEAGDVEASEPYEVGIRGVSAPLKVARVAWSR